MLYETKVLLIAIAIPANENIFCVCTRIIAVRQGRIDRRVLVAVRKVKPDAALRQKDRADAENVFVRGYKIICTAKSLKEAYKTVAEMANAEGVLLKPYDEARAELE